MERECVCSYHCCHEDKYHKIEKKKDINESGHTFFYDRKYCRVCGVWIGDKVVLH